MSIKCWRLKRWVVYILRPGKSAIGFSASLSTNDSLLALLEPMAPIRPRPISPDQQLSNFRLNLTLADAANLARSPDHPDGQWTANCGTAGASRPCSGKILKADIVSFFASYWYMTNLKLKVIYMHTWLTCYWNVAFLLFRTWLLFNVVTSICGNYITFISKIFSPWYKMSILH